MGQDVFISHSSKDIELVRYICSKIEESGISCWFSERDIPGGVKFPGQIVDAIDKSKAMLLVYSPDADKSKHVLSEIGCAFEKSMRIIPYKTAIFEPGLDMRYYVPLYQAINAYAMTKEEACKLLLNDLRQCIPQVSEGIIVDHLLGTTLVNDQLISMRLFVMDIQSGDLSLWVKSGRSGLDNLKTVCKMLSIEQGVKILACDEIISGHLMELNNDFKNLVLKTNGMAGLDTIRRLENDVLVNVLNDSAKVEETIEGIYTVSLKNKLILNTGYQANNKPNNEVHLKITSDSEAILVGGDMAILVAQLYTGEDKRLKPGTSVTFSIMENALASLPEVNTCYTNALGRAEIYLTSKDLPGVVTIVAETCVDGETIKDTTKIKLLEWGVISGIVLDKNSLGIPRSTVKLWQCEYDPETDEYTPTRLLRTPENPQYSMDLSFDSVGRYTFYRVPSGYYRITADKADSSGQIHSYFTNVHLKKGTKCSCIVIPDYVQVMPVVSSKPR